MRFCNKTKEIIESSYITMSANDICDVITNQGLRKRSASSIQVYIDKLIERDKVREERRLKFAAKALADPIKYRASTLLAGAKQRADKKGIDCDLDRKWIEDKLRQGCCEATGIKFFIKEYSSKEEYTKVHPFSPSLDQIKPSGGYTKDNVQVVCDQFNKLKGDRHEVWAYKLAEEYVINYKRKHSLRVKGRKIELEKV